VGRVQHDPAVALEPRRSEAPRAPLGSVERGSFAWVTQHAACPGAFAFSIFNWRERKRQDQRDLFLKIHERLVDMDLQRGRRIIYLDVHSVEQAKALFQKRPADYDLGDRALAMLDLAALYE